MNCFCCRRVFDEATYVPRLLIICGHSLCEQCIAKAYSSGRVVCPDCQTSNPSGSIQGYPKNLALINKEGRERGELCPRHTKKFEGRTRSIQRSATRTSSCCA